MQAIASGSLTQTVSIRGLFSVHYRCSLSRARKGATGLAIAGELGAAWRTTVAHVSFANSDIVCGEHPV